MQHPEMQHSLDAAPDTTALVSWAPVPGIGVLAVNSFVIRAKEPVLVDAGLGALGDDYMARLREAIDPSELRWIWLTHTDPDHVGNLARVLEQAPEARVVTNYLGMGKLGLLGMNVERSYLVNPGQSLDVGDRTLVALRPPTFDAPETMALFDTKTRALFSSDCFGAVVDQPVESAAAVESSRLRDGMRLWTTVDAPWLGAVDERLFRRELIETARLDAAHVLSSHLPPGGDAETFLRWLGEAKDASPFVGPDQAAVEAMLATA